MPAIIVANRDTKAATVSWVGWDGLKATTKYSGFPAGATEAQIIAIINAAGAISNAAIFRQQYNSVSEASIQASVALDESVSQVERGANVTYQNATTLELKMFRIPAPHHDYLTSDGRFLGPRLTTPLVQTLLTAIETALGAGWNFVNAPLTTRNRGTTSSIAQPVLEEPA